MDEEMAALDANYTWELMPLPHDKKAIDYKWVYKVKHNADGFMSMHKASLVAKDMHKHMALTMMKPSVQREGWQL